MPPFNAVEFRGDGADVVEISPELTDRLGLGKDLGDGVYKWGITTFSRLITLVENELDIEHLTDAEVETAYNNQVPLVSLAEAQAGTETAVRRWSPERVADAIAALAGGGGDMFAAVYDPAAVAGDAFDMDNMVEGVNLILTAAERAKLSALTQGAFVADVNTQITPETAILLDQAAGDEISLDLSFTVNKAAGSYTGIKIDATETAAPGASNLLFEAGVGGTPLAWIDNAGKVTAVDAAFTGTTAIELPSGTTAQQPGAPVEGMLRWNTDATTGSEPWLGALEVYRSSDSAWRNVMDRGMINWVIDPDSGGTETVTNGENISFTGADGINTSRPIGAIITWGLTDGGIALAKMADMATASFIGRNTAGSGPQEVLSAATARSILNVEDGATADQTSIVGITGTMAEFDTALTDENFVFIDEAQTLTNKTIGHDDFTNHIHADVTHVQVRNESGGTINRGDAVYISGYSIGQDLPLVDLADSSSSATMPAFAIISSVSIANNANGSAYIAGRLIEMDTTGWSEGDVLYVSNVGTTGNTLQNTPPTGTDLIEPIAEVMRGGHATLGRIEVETSGDYIRVPNIASANFWLGNGSGVATAVTMSGDATMDNAGAVTLDPTAISGLGLVTAVATDMVLLWDATDSQLKRADVNDFLGGGGLTNWEENGTTLQPKVAGYDFGAVGNEVGNIVSNGTLTLGNDVILERQAAGILQLGTDHATTPTQQTIQAHDVTVGTGANLVLSSGTGSVSDGIVYIDPGDGGVQIGTTISGYSIFQSGSQIDIQSNDLISIIQGADLSVGNALEIRQEFSTRELTSSNSRQAGVYIKHETAQTGTAAFDALYVDSVITTTGDGTTGDGNNLLNLSVSGSSLFRVDTTGLVTVDVGLNVDGGTMRIPLSAAPTMAVDGDFAIDTTIADMSHGLIKYFDGEELAVIAVPIAQLTTPTDGHFIAYNATNDEFELKASAGSGDVTKVGTPTDNAIGVWTGDGTIEGNTASHTFEYSAGVVTTYRSVNDGNPEIRIGAADAEEAHIQVVYEAGTQLIDYLLFQTDVASTNSDLGMFRFNVDGVVILDIDDGGINMASGMALSINGADVIDGTSLGAGVTSSSLTSVGTIGTGVWEGTAVATGFIASTLTGKALTGVTTLSLDDTDSVFNLVLQSTSTITTADKTLTFDVNDANRTLTISGDATISGTNTGDSQTLAAGVSDVTATAAEVNLLDLAGLTVGWVLSADTSTTASWKAPTSGALDDITDVTITTPDTGALLYKSAGDWIDLAAGGTDDVLHGGATPSWGAVDLATAQVTGVLPSANLDADTMHLSGTQSVTGDKVFDGLFLNDTDSAFNLEIQSTSTLTADRILTIDVNDGAKSIDMGGNLTISSGGATVQGTNTGDSQTLAAGVSDVTALAAEVNLLDLAGLTVGWVLSADSATTASWKAPTGGGAFTANGDTEITPTTAIVLDVATGNEIGLDLSLTVNKATSGNYTGLKLIATETAAPGTDDRLLDLGVGANSTLVMDNGAMGSQFLRLYNAFTDIDNNESLEFGWTSNIAYVRTDGPGTGGSRALNIGGASISFLASGATAAIMTSAGLSMQGGTKLFLDDTDSLFTLGLVSTSTITGTNKTLTFDVNDSDRTLTLSGDATVSGTNTGDSQTLAAGVSDVTATAAEVNLLDLAGLTVGWVLSADSATTASWKAPGGGSGTVTDLNGANDRIAVWTGATEIEGTADFTYASQLLTIGDATGSPTIRLDKDELTTAGIDFYKEGVEVCRLEVSTGEQFEIWYTGTKILSAISTEITFSATNGFGSNNTGGAWLERASSSLTVPYVRRVNDANTGMGGDGSDGLALISNSKSALVATDAGTAVNVELFGSAGLFGATIAGEGVLRLNDVTTVPTGTMTSGGLLYVSGTAIHFLADDGTDTDLTAGGSGAFDDSGDPVVLNTTTKMVEIGPTLAGNAKLTVKGDADMIQLKVSGNATQTTPVLEVESNTSTKLLQVWNDGDVLISGDIDLGHASDTTISRTGAGVVAIEGVEIATISASQVLTNKTIDGDNNTLSNLDLGNEVNWGSIGDVIDRLNPPAAGDKLLIFEVGSGLRKFDWSELPGGGSGMVTGISLNSGANVNAANRSVLNFIEGSGIDLTIADDPGGDEVDITVAISGYTGETSIVTTGTVTAGTWASDITLASGDTMDAGAADSVEIPNGAGGTTLDAAGEICIDTTQDGNSGSFNFHDGTAERVIKGEYLKSITVEDPVTGEDITIWYTPFAITIRAVEGVVIGSASPDIDVSIRHNTDRSAAGNNVFAADRTVSSTTSGDNLTLGGDVTIPAASFIWLETSGTPTGTVDELHLTIQYTVDP